MLVTLLFYSKRCILSRFRVLCKMAKHKLSDILALEPKTTLNVSAKRLERLKCYTTRMNYSAGGNPSIGNCRNNGIGIRVAMSGHINRIHRSSSFTFSVNENISRTNLFRNKQNLLEYAQSHLVFFKMIIRSKILTSPNRVIGGPSGREMNEEEIISLWVVGL